MNGAGGQSVCLTTPGIRFGDIRVNNAQSIAQKNFNVKLWCMIGRNFAPYPINGAPKRFNAILEVGNSPIAMFFSSQVFYVAPFSPRLPSS